MSRAFSIASVILGMALLAACSAPVLDIPEPKAEHSAAAQTALERSIIGPSRNLAPADIFPAIKRVASRVHESAYRICQELRQPDEDCNGVDEMILNIHVANAEYNAFADQADRINIFGGLVSVLGTDDEIAAVLAHEYAHVIYDHVGKKVSNAMVGTLIASALAGAFSAHYGVNDQQMNENWMRLGMEIGSRSYSPEMEIEADRTAAYILRDAGFSPWALADVIVRMHRLNVEGADGPFSGRVGFLETHPSDDRRVAHIISAIEDAESGVPLETVRRKISN